MDATYNFPNMQYGRVRVRILGWVLGRDKQIVAMLALLEDHQETQQRRGWVIEGRPELLLCDLADAVS